MKKGVFFYTEQEAQAHSFRQACKSTKKKKKNK
jgi:hypothetical protein